MSDDEDSRAGEDGDDALPSGRLDVPTLQTLARRAATHPLVDDWAFDPSSVSPLILRLSLAASAYPTEITAARLDVRWFVTGDYSVHYLETHDGEARMYQCRWDRHPKTSAPRTHFHPPPVAGEAEPSSLSPRHLDVLFAVLNWVLERVEQLYS